MNMIDYRPQKNGFPYKVLKYLYDNGRCSGVNIQENTGLNEWANSKGIIFYSRASIVLDDIFRQLDRRGLLIRYEDDEYELSAEGKAFMKTYKVR